MVEWETFSFPFAWYRIDTLHLCLLIYRLCYCSRGNAIDVNIKFVTGSTDWDRLAKALVKLTTLRRLEILMGEASSQMASRPLILARTQLCWSSWSESSHTQACSHFCTESRNDEFHAKLEFQDSYQRQIAYCVTFRALAWIILDTLVQAL